MIRHIIWDWNGTLLDDVDCCVDTLNVLLAARGMPAVSRDMYRARFGFPVKDFYLGLGFDFGAEDFGALSHEFIADYRVRVAASQLGAGALALLRDLQAGGIGHVVLSAMERTLLGDMLQDYGVRPLLKAFHGTADLRAGSKVEVGVAAMRELGFSPDEVLLVGDTLHDHETAQTIGCRCVLFSGGHQSRERLTAAGVDVVDSLAEVVALCK